MAKPTPKETLWPVRAYGPAAVAWESPKVTETPTTEQDPADAGSDTSNAALAPERM